MRLRLWLTSFSAALGTFFTTYRLNPRALAHLLALSLIYSGLAEWSPAAARTITGSILMLTLYLDRSSPSPTRNPAPR